MTCGHRLHLLKLVFIQIVFPVKVDVVQAPFLLDKFLRKVLHLHLREVQLGNPDAVLDAIEVDRILTILENLCQFEVKQSAEVVCCELIDVLGILRHIQLYNVRASVVKDCGKGSLPSR